MKGGNGAQEVTLRTDFGIWSRFGFERDAEHGHTPRVSWAGRVERGGAGDVRPDGLRRLLEASAGVAARQVAGRRARRDLLARDPAGVHARPDDHQPEQRRRLPEPARRPRGVEALPRHLEPGARVPHVADPRAEHRERAADARGRRRMPTPRRSRSRATPAKRCRSRSSASTSSPATKCSRPIRTTAACCRRGTSASRATDQADEDLVSGAADVQADLVKRFEAAITPATKVLHFCHITNLTGHIFPVQGDLRAGAAARPHDDRRRRARLRALSVRLRDFDCDFYGTSLHKWLLAPIGTGSSTCGGIGSQPLWALQPAPASMAATSASSRRSARIRRRITTRSPRRSSFITASAPSARPRACATSRTRWARRLKTQAARSDPHAASIPRSRARSARSASTACRRRRSPRSSGTKWRIIATPIAHAEYQGIRVTPNVYTTLEEIDTFADAMEAISET